MSSYRPSFFVRQPSRIPTIHTPSKLCQLGQRQILPRPRGYVSFRWEVSSRSRSRIEAQKIWGGSRTLSSKAMVDDRGREVDPSYLHWFFDQALKVMPGITELVWIEKRN
ncbi:hypothetical protein H5410_034790 [Solanum commersonii]|uniref:Uncharacterized protein n=1 Tax=Solanum commersonii TaxID=4109 RepID=A0A9J5YWG4_SOLCO|nr:hypothetical protein H5410_034790 [Solanum commersonii]